MKLFSNVIAVLFSSTLLISSAVAAGASAHYGASQPANTPRTNIPGEVVVTNYTYLYYNVHAVYQPTQYTYDMPLGPDGTGSDTIYYDYDYPDYAICFDIDDFNGMHVYDGCVSGGTIYIFPPVAAGNTANAVAGQHQVAGKPIVKVTK
jgi:hypothetical protein